MKAVRYYVVYEIWKDGDVTGKATSEMVMKRKIRERKDIEDMEAAIEKDKRIPEGSNAVIVNYILMDDEVEVDVKSEAEEMFKELGYTEVKEMRRNNGELWGIEYFHGREDISISFDLVGKEFCVANAESDAMYFSMGELKAINKKCEELGWM